MKKRICSLIIALLMIVPVLTGLTIPSTALASLYEVEEGAVSVSDGMLENGTLMVNGGLASDIGEDRRWHIVTDGEFSDPFADYFTSSADTFPASGLITPKDGMHSVALTFEKPQVFSKLIFQQGYIYWDGGWFDGSVKIEVYNGKTWTEVKGVVWDNEYNIVLDPNVPQFPVESSNQALGAEFCYLIYEVEMPADVVGYGLRIIGKAGGSAHFISCAEFQVYGRRSLYIPGEAEYAPKIEKNIKNEAVKILANGTDVTAAAAAIRDNVYRAFLDSTRNENRYDTFDNWATDGRVSFGYEFAEAKTISGLAFQFAEFYDNGGWFIGSVSVEYLNAENNWVAVTGLSGTNLNLPESNTKADLIMYVGSTIIADFDEVETKGIRIIAAGAGKAGAEWVGCSEFDVFAVVDQTNEYNKLSKDVVSVIKVNGVDQTTRFAPVIDGVYREKGDGTRDDNRADTYNLGVDALGEAVFEFEFTSAQTLNGFAWQYADMYWDGGWFVDTLKFEYYDTATESWKPVTGLTGNTYTPNVLPYTDPSQGGFPPQIVPYIGETLVAYFDEVTTTSLRMRGSPALGEVLTRFACGSEVDFFTRGEEIVSIPGGEPVLDPSVETVTVDFTGVAEYSDVVVKGEEMNITVKVPEGKKILSVKANDVLIEKASGTIFTSAVYKYTPVENTTIKILFAEAQEFTVTLAGENATFENSSVKIKEGDSLTVEVTPATGYELDSVQATNATAQVKGGKVKISDVTADATVTVTMKLKSYNLKFIINGGGSIECDKKTATIKDVVEYTIVLPEGNYKIASVKVNGKELTEFSENMRLENISSNTTVIVTVEEAPADTGNQPGDSTPDKGGLSTGAIIGIVIAGVVVVGGGVAAFLIVKKKKGAN